LRIAGEQDPEVFASEYALSEIGLREHQVFYNEPVQRLLEDPLTEGNRAGVQRMLSAPKDCMKVSMGWLDANFGVRDYLTDMVGMEKGDIEKIQATLVVPDRAILRHLELF
jgi:hypothetical protein